MLFSVIVPFLNEEKYLKECIESLLAQDFDKEEYELIFVDNGSTDNSLGIIKEYPEIKLLHEPKKNVYAARNTALKAAQGEIIAFTDADCFVAKDWLAQIYKGMESARATIALGKVSFGRNPPLYLRVIQDYWNFRIGYLLANNYTSYSYAYNNNMAIRSGVLKELGGFKELSVIGDTEFAHRCLARYADCRIIYLDKMEVIHLEISGLAGWLKKTFIYGRYDTFFEKETTRKSFAKKSNYGFFEWIVSVIFIKINFIAFELGRFVGKYLLFTKPNLKRGKQL